MDGDKFACACNSVALGGDIYSPDVNRGRPFGSKVWIRRIAIRLELEYAIRPRGRPRKASKSKARPLAATKRMDSHRNNFLSPVILFPFKGCVFRFLGYQQVGRTHRQHPAGSPKALKAFLLRSMVKAL